MGPSHTIHVFVPDRFLLYFSHSAENTPFVHSPEALREEQKTKLISTYHSIPGIIPADTD